MNLFWFRRDLRLSDNRALFEAVKGGNFAAIYIFDTNITSLDDYSLFHKDFIIDSINELDIKFRRDHGYLNKFEGPALEVFKSITENYNIKKVFSASEIEWQRHQTNGVTMNLKNRDGWSQLWSSKMDRAIISTPNLFSSKNLDLNFRFRYQDFPEFMGPNYNKLFKGGEKNSQYQLNKFLNESGLQYSKNISSPLTSPDSCSRLSSFLAFGNISMRQVVQATKIRQNQLRKNKVRNGWLKSLSAFSSRLRWHCHFIQKLEMQPELEFTNMVTAFDGIRDSSKIEYFDAWKSGKVGYPMVDACMRFLKKNGWINFRMRAMLVSFASYNLWIDWRLTSKFLSKYFIDYEPGIHYNQFQMQSGVTGINAIRIYNPIKQQIDHDPDGIFIKNWCPELENVPDDYLQYPHMMSEALQKRIGCLIGKDYPKPVVDLRKSTLMAKKLIFEVKSTSAAKKQSVQAYILHGSRKKQKSKR